MKAETGLVHAQLSKNSNLDFSITFFDKIGVIHKINLKDTEFIIQKKATPFLSYLKDLVKNNKIENAKSALDSFILHLQHRCAKGILDWDPRPALNYGFIENKAVEIDIGSYSYSENIKDSTNQEIEVKAILQSIRNQIHELGSSELEDYFDCKIQNPLAN